LSLPVHPSAQAPYSFFRQPETLSRTAAMSGTRPTTRNVVETVR
jgi:hypothetical protein